MGSLSDTFNAVNKIPKATMTWIIIVLGAAVMFFAKHWYSTSINQGERMLYKMDTLVNFGRENRRLIIENHDATRKVVDRQRLIKDAVDGLKVGQSELNQKLNAVAKDNTSLKAEFRRIEEASRSFQDAVGMHAETHDTLYRIESRHADSVPTEKLDDIKPIKPKDENAIDRKLRRIFKRMLNE